ncbi:MAG: ATPase, T2SS/T4P/T4SS family [Acetomicrobium sp.]
MSWIKNLPGLKLLGEILIEQGKITREQLTEALALQKQKGTRLGSVLIELGYVHESDILEVFARYLGMTHIPRLDRRSLDDLRADYSFIAEFPSDTLMRLGVIPFRLETESRVDQPIQIWKFHVVVSDPWIYDEVSLLIDSYIKRYFADHDIGISIYDVSTEIIGYLAESSDISSLLADISATSSVSVFNRDEEQAAGKLFYDVMSFAISQNGTDIHISPLHARGGLWIRTRIDGNMRDYLKDARFSTVEYNTLVNRIMTMANMDTTRKREPQDGGMEFPYNRIMFDVRVAAVPTYLMSATLDAVKLQLRIFYRHAQLSLTELGLLDDDLQTVRQLYSAPSGILLVTGPTSSGKTTTLNSVLRMLDLESQVCYTVEDPVEYHLDNAYQIQVSEREGRSFADILKSLMRLDPDIVLLGEIRDKETAIIATQMANTGHSVFSTLHTNSAWTAAQRLLVMGVPSYLIVGNLNGIIAQRLVQKNCPDCTEEYDPTDQVLSTLGLSREFPFYKGTGKIKDGMCPTCRGRGYKGRIGIFEIAPLALYEGWEKFIDRPIRLHEFFTSLGRRDLMGDAKEKMRLGLVSPDSLIGVLARMESVIKSEAE